MLYNTMRTLEYRLQSPCVGDLRARELIKYFKDTDEKVLGYKGKSAVNVERYKYYRDLFIEDNYSKWFSGYTKTYIDRVFWFLRRLKCNITPQQEYDLLLQYIDRMPMYDKYFELYGSGVIVKNVELNNYFKRNGVKF